MPRGRKRKNIIPKSCDVCRSTESIKNNQLLTCKICSLNVHQECYGIVQVPPNEQFICSTCPLKKKPKCALCPSRGGALKPTKSGKKWAHIICVLWIPEVSFESIIKLEPIINITHVLSYRYKHTCSICGIQEGACIDCSAPGCTVSYHVTCAFIKGLEMRTETVDGDDIIRSYCESHWNVRGLKLEYTEIDGQLRKKRMLNAEKINELKEIRVKLVEKARIGRIYPVEFDSTMYPLYNIELELDNYSE